MAGPRGLLGRDGRFAAAPDDLAILVYTSGTTGPPKGAMLSHRNIVTQMRHATDVLSYRDGEERLAFLPMCHVAERVAGCYYGIATRRHLELCGKPGDGAGEYARAAADAVSARCRGSGSGSIPRS